MKKTKEQSFKVKRQEKLERMQGITLVALVVTIVVLLISAGITLVYAVGDNSVFKQALEAKLEYQIAQAREKIEITFGHAQILKHTEPKYNQDDYLDNLMKNEISNIKIEDDIVIVDGFAFEIDRSVPKIGQYLGKEEDLIFPEITATVTLATDNKTATINITALEEKNGINKIEIWQLGEKIKEYIYDQANQETTEIYTAMQNGTYTIKAYGNLWASKRVEVDGIVPSVKFEPNGSEEWKKIHSTTVTIEETKDKIINAKYYWSNSIMVPDDDAFKQTFNSGNTIIENGNILTGTYYLWTMLTTQSGEKVKWRSEGFNFDNDHNGGRFGWSAETLNSIKLWATSDDKESGPDYAEFYVDGNRIAKVEFLLGRAEFTSNEISSGYHEIKVVFHDKVGNTSSGTLNARTKLYGWKKCKANVDYTYEERSEEWSGYVNGVRGDEMGPNKNVSLTVGSGYTFNKNSGNFELSQNTRNITFDRSSLPIDASGFVRFEGGEGIGYTGTSKSIVEIKELQRELGYYSRKGESWWFATLFREYSFI